MENVEIDQLAEKFGGRFKFTVLLQKRVKELVKGSPKLVELEDRNLIKIALEEIRQGKVGFEGFVLEEEAPKKSSKKKE